MGGAAVGVVHGVRWIARDNHLGLSRPIQSLVRGRRRIVLDVVLITSPPGIDGQAYVKSAKASAVGSSHLIDPLLLMNLPLWVSSFVHGS